MRLISPGLYAVANVGTGVVYYKEGKTYTTDRLEECVRRSYRTPELSGLARVFERDISYGSLNLADISGSHVATKATCSAGVSLGCLSDYI